MEATNGSDATLVHIKQVYTNSAYMLSTTAMGVAFCIYHSLSSDTIIFVSTICQLALIACMFTTKGVISHVYRQIMLLLFGFFSGCNISSLIEHIHYIDPRIVPTALIGSVVIFTTLSYKALTTEKGGFLYLRSFLYSSLSLIMVTSLMGFFFQTDVAFLINLYVGLLVFCGYILYDTHLIIDRFEGGDDDHLTHSMILFIDFIGIFVRVLIIITNHTDKLDNKKKND
jgi:FtsH-binding integral membrane protein